MLDLVRFSISRPISDQGTLYPGDTLTEIGVETANISNQFTCRVSRASVTLSSHAGTHADRPPHFMQNASVSDFTPTQYEGRCTLLDVSELRGESYEITGEMLRTALDGIDSPHLNFLRESCILVKTHQAGAFPISPPEQFPYFSKDAIAQLASWGCKMVGLDSLSVDHPSEGNLEGSNHGALFAAGIAIVENLDLTWCDSGTGTVSTIFDPVREFPDARGVAAMFYFPDL